MTENEAIKVMKWYSEEEYGKGLVSESHSMAIQALEKQSMVNEILHELREYSAIGTIEEFKALKEQNAELHCEFQSINATMDLFEKEIKAKVIDEFAEQMKELVYKWIDKGVIAFGCIDEIAEQMKGSENNG